MTLYLDLPGKRGKLDRLISEFDAVVLPGPPRGLDDVPPDKALVCVVDMGEYEAPGYLLTEAEFAVWNGAVDEGVKTWLLMDRDTADALCPGAAEDRQSWQEGTMERDAEAAAHTDSLVPVARVSRWTLGGMPGCCVSTLQYWAAPAPGFRMDGRKASLRSTSLRPICWLSRRSWSPGLSVTGSPSSTSDRSVSTWTGRFRRPRGRPPNDRLDECVATLDRERMAIEIVFRLRENGADYLFWVNVHGADGISFDPGSAIDRDHLKQAKRTKEPG